MTTPKLELPPQTSHKAWSSAFTALLVGGITWFGARQGLELSDETAGLLAVVLAPIGAGFGAWVQRNYQKMTEGAGQ